MKKILIFLVLLVSGVYVYAQKDTIFVRESELVNEPIKVGIPDSLINSKGTIAQNGEAYYFHKDVLIKTTFSRRYGFLFDRVTRIETILYFDKDTGKMEIKNLKPIKSDSEFAWFTFIICFLFLFFSVFMQKDALKSTLSNVPRKALVLLAFATWSFPFLVFDIILKSDQISMVILVLFCTIGTLVIFYFWRLSFKDYKGIRDSYIFSNTIILIIFLFFSLTRPVAISALIGLLLGLPSIYFWKSLKNRKKVHKLTDEQQLFVYSDVD